MEWLNYHHLLYFWVVAKHGSITQASKELRLAHPTISGQIHRLEEVLGAKLFTRKGRNLVLTDSGRIAFRYADEIFSLGQEFQDTLKGRSSGQQLRLVVGVSDVLAKSIVHRILEPAFELQGQVRVICRENRSLEAFMGDLASTRWTSCCPMRLPVPVRPSARSAIRWASAALRSSQRRDSPPRAAADFRITRRPPGPGAR